MHQSHFSQYTYTHTQSLCIMQIDNIFTFWHLFLKCVELNATELTPSFSTCIKSDTLNVLHYLYFALRQMTLRIVNRIYGWESGYMYIEYVVYLA